MLWLSSSRSDQPDALPTLPTELKRYILSFADPATLAIASRASFAFLEMASELLYEHTEVVGLERLYLFFRNRCKSSPRIEALLSFRRITTLTLIAPSDFIPRVLLYLSSTIHLYFPLDRTDGNRIRIDRLTIVFEHELDEGGDDDPLEVYVSTPFLHLFDPTAVTLSLKRLVPGHEGMMVTWDPVIEVRAWTHLQEVRLVQCWAEFEVAVDAVHPHHEVYLSDPFDDKAHPSKCLQGVVKADNIRHRTICVGTTADQERVTEMVRSRREENNRVRSATKVQSEILVVVKRCPEPPVPRQRELPKPTQPSVQPRRPTKQESPGFFGRLSLGWARRGNAGP